MEEKTKLERILDRATTVVAILMSIYHLVAANFIVVSAEQHINIHITFALVIIFLQAIKIKSGKPTWQSWGIIGLLVLSVATAAYIHFHTTAFKMAMGAQPLDKILSGAIMLVIILLATGKIWGKVIPAIAVIALLYGYFGPYMPGIFFHGGLSLPRLITYVTTNFTGIYGMLSSVSANTIVLFTIFAGMMESFGAIRSIMDVAMSASTKIRSGGAQVAVMSSGLIGTITGSVAANISMTSPICVPLMRKRGYPNEFIAACEAAAATGGAILPPVMNAAAFIISSWTSVPYITVALIGATPAVLYYLGISLSVYIKALKLGDEKVKDELLPQFHKAFGNLFLFLIPIILLVVLMARSYSPQKALYLSTFCLIFVGLIKEFLARKEGVSPIKSFFKKLLAGFESGGKTVAGIAIVMACMGVVVEILTSTGLPSKISQFTLVLAGNNLFLLAVLVAITCTVFGMGMPSASAYILTALLGAPALTTFGVPVLVAHFFVFYFAELSALTPPVAIGCLVASGLANANFFKTCLVSIRLAIAGFVLPFLFLYRPELLLQGTLPQYLWAVLMVVMFLVTFIIGCEGFFMKKLTMLERVLAFAAAICLVVPIYVMDFIGVGISIFLLITHFRSYQKEKKTLSAQAG